MARYRPPQLPHPLGEGREREELERQQQEVAACLVRVAWIEDALALESAQHVGRLDEHELRCHEIATRKNGLRPGAVTPRVGRGRDEHRRVDDHAHRRSPYVLQESVDKHYYDELIPIGGPDAIAWSRRLAAEEGIFTGISGGASLAVAIQVAERAAEGSVICCMLPDTGERYVSTPLFEGVATEMTADEEALSRSTPGYQMPPG